MKFVKNNQVDEIMDSLFFGAISNLKLEINSQNKAIISGLQKYTKTVPWLKVFPIAVAGTKKKWVIISKVTVEHEGCVIFVDFKNKRRLEKTAA